jgi:hypothetical protein
MLNVVMPNVMSFIVKLNAITLSVIVLNVVAPVTPI